MRAKNATVSSFLLCVATDSTHKQRKTKILLLDEATANYDYGSEAEFNKYIANDRSFDFYIIISHRKDILQIVDKVINIEDGQVKIMRKGKK